MGFVPNNGQSVVVGVLISWQGGDKWCTARCCCTMCWNVKSKKEAINERLARTVAKDDKRKTAKGLAMQHCCGKFHQQSMFFALARTQFMFVVMLILRWCKKVLQWHICFKAHLHFITAIMVDLVNRKFTMMKSKSSISQTTFLVKFVLKIINVWNFRKFSQFWRGFLFGINGALDPCHATHG